MHRTILKVHSLGKKVNTNGCLKNREESDVPSLVGLFHNSVLHARAITFFGPLVGIIKQVMIN
jgi:hypothetical protein